MNEYVIQQKLATLTYNSVIALSQNYSDFILDGVSFSHWDFSHQKGWNGEAWLIEFKVKGLNANEVAEEFYKKTINICPKIAFIGQAYTSVMSQPFIIIKNNKDIYLDMKSFEKPISLSFGESELKALKHLLNENTLLKGEKIPKEFYYYWNEAVNAVGYTSKLLLLTSAIECLVKPQGTKSKKYALIAEILGEELKDVIWKQKIGIRQRLVHGEYLSRKDTEVDYAEQIHKKVISYFNNNVFRKKLISEDVVRPHRNYNYGIQQEKLFLEIKSNFFISNQQPILKYIIDNYEKIKEDKDEHIKLSAKPFIPASF
jgi:hypothetical protein